MILNVKIVRINEFVVKVKVGVMIEEEKVEQ